MMHWIRSPLGGRIIAWMLVNMSFAIPVQRLCETATLLAFHHPRPSYRVHILLVPKRAIRDLEALGDDDQDFMVDLFACVRRLVAEFGLREGGYRLIANGGCYQDVPHLHFHLIAE